MCPHVAFQEGESPLTSLAEDGIPVLSHDGRCQGSKSVPIHPVSCRHNFCPCLRCVIFPASLSSGSLPVKTLHWIVHRVAWAIIDMEPRCKCGASSPRCMNTGMGALTKVCNTGAVFAGSFPGCHLLRTSKRRNFARFGQPPPPSGTHVAGYKCTRCTRSAGIRLGQAQVVPARGGAGPAVRARGPSPPPPPMTGGVHPPTARSCS